MAKTTRKRVSHRKREVCRDEPLHIGVQLLPGLPSMRTPGAKLVVFEAVRAMRGRFGFRIVEFAVMQTFSKHPPPTQRATYMALQCARRFLIELDDKPMPPPPLPDRRKRRRLFDVVQPAT